MSKLMKFICVLLAAILCAFMIGGCSNYFSPIISQDPDEVGLSPTYYVNPQAGGEVKGKHNVILYYRFLDEPMLVGYSTFIELGAETQLEKMIIQRILEGPSDETLELRSMNKQNVQVVNISEQKETLFVTLSKELLQAPENAPDDWKTRADWLEPEMQRRALTLYAIVNSITQLGEYSHVQFLVDREGQGNGQRVTYEEVGIKVDAADQLLGPIARNSETILSPKNTLNVILQSYRRNEWSRLYKYVAPLDQNNTSKPALDQLGTELSTSGRLLDSFTILEDSISEDGQEALVTVNLVFNSSDGTMVPSDSTPIRLKRDHGVWKVQYEVLLETLGKK